MGVDDAKDTQPPRSPIPGSPPKARCCSPSPALLFHQQQARGFKMPKEEGEQHRGDSKGTFLEGSSAMPQPKSREALPRVEEAPASSLTLPPQSSPFLVRRGGAPTPPGGRGAGPPGPAPVNHGCPPTSAFSPPTHSPPAALTPLPVTCEFLCLVPFPSNTHSTCRSSRLRVLSGHLRAQCLEPSGNLCQSDRQSLVEEEGAALVEAKS